MLQSSFSGILEDVGDDTVKLVLRPDEMIKVFALPEFAGTFEKRVGAFR